MFFHTYEDGDGRLLEGESRYELTFPADSLPPVRAFWTLTAYTPDYNLVGNAIERYAIGDRTEGLQFNEDGSLTLFVQSTEPEDWRPSNWLPPPPRGLFRLNSWMYNPDLEVLTPETVERFIPKIRRQDRKSAKPPGA